MIEGLSHLTFVATLAGRLARYAEHKSVQERRGVG